ncbi:MAG: GFA family protein [Pseudomonadota bacterium]
MADETKGACFCGAVEITLSGRADSMGYCHCESCRQWSGDPVHAWTIWSEGQVSITKGEAQVRTFQKSPESLSHRKFCLECGGHFAIHHPTLGIYDVFPGVLKDFEFDGRVHINCAEWVMRATDDLPKFKDFPPELTVAFGGTGEPMP